MKWLLIGIVLTALIGLAVLVGLTFASGGGQALKAGVPAPDFSLAGSDGKTHRLADLKGKQAVVVAWFPKAFTGG